MTVEQKREFNTFGPVNPIQHYHVNRVAVKAALRAKIERGRYFTLNASRQTGKTTLFREVIAELEAEGLYRGILVSFETLRGYNRQEFYYWLQQKLLDDLQGQVEANISYGAKPAAGRLRSVSSICC
jgi:predicted AAA+ superfamily ATPase